jgi:beta-lactamase regulating signal transducer with metallopeptidase domain
MTPFDFEPLAGWLGTFALHSTCALAAALAVCALLRGRAPVFQEGLLRFSAWAALVSATLQVAAFSEPPAAGRSAPLPGPSERAAAVPAPLADEAGAALVREASLRLDLPSSSVVAAIAGGSALLGLTWFLVLFRRQRRALARRRPETDPRLLAMASRVACDVGLREAPRQSRCDDVATPIAFGWLRPELCLPSRAAGLDDASLRAMLAHEIAHLRRGDPGWTLFFALLQAAFPWQVLMVAVRRRWTRLVELQCDAVAARSSSPTAVARCLLTVAEWLRPGDDEPTVALGMAARPSLLRERIEAALRPQRAAPERRTLRLACGGLSLSALTLAAPGVHCAPPAAEAEPAPVAAAMPDDPVLAAMHLLAMERHALFADAMRLRAELDGRPLDPELEQLKSALDRRLSTLERLSARLTARLGRRTTEPR